MKQTLICIRFGLISGWLEILKKRFGADYEQLWRAFFSCFRGQQFFFLIFLTFFYLYSMQLFSADATIFSKHFYIYFLSMKTLKNGPQKLLMIGPKLFFSQYWPGCPNQPRIDFSYYKYDPRLICLLICD